TASPFLSLADTTVATGTPSIFGPLVQVAGVGGTSATTVATMSLAGPLLSATNGLLNIGGPLLSVGSSTPAENGVVTTNGSTASLISFTGTPAGASHRIAGAMFDLAGIATTTADPDPDATTPNINSWSLVNVAGGSFMSVRGNLVSLDNNSTLNILAGSLFSVSNGSVFRLTGGSLGVFGSTGTNTINITNTAALCNGCSIVTNITNFNFPVLLKAGASTSNVSVGLGF